MRRLTIFGIIAIVGLLFAPVAVIGQKGPPGGLDVNVVNTPLPVTVQPDGLSVNVSTVYQFVGYTTDPVSISGGVVSMHGLCQAAGFGDLSRMCTSKEFWTSPAAIGPPLDPGFAWIQPTIVGILPGATALASLPLDFSGGSPGLGTFGKSVIATCSQWTSDSSGDRGAGVLKHVLQSGPEMFLSGQSCDKQNLVTCCAPANQ
jgi:hypothetical protein